MPDRDIINVYIFFEKEMQLLELTAVKKITFLLNTVILILVFGLMAFFTLCDVPFLVFFSIPTSMVYIIGYYLIHKDRLHLYVRIIYFWLTLYMGLTTLCLGYGYGFHLYCFSMVPIIFATEYLAHKLNMKCLKAIPVSIAIALFYLGCTGYVAYYGPIYERDQRYAAFFWSFNAIIVFGFIIYYSNYMIKTIISSEDKLLEAAHTDRLTRLHNRHYMLNYLNSLEAKKGHFTLAMSDIDSFKKINDTYGHNAGDEVLKAVSGKMREICSECEIARWGGEEFLLLFSCAPDNAAVILEELRKALENEPVIFDDKSIRVTITTGIAENDSSYSIDQWIQAADNKLYFGKNNGKNRVIR